jgi:hypothetical protein
MNNVSERWASKCARWSRLCFAEVLLLDLDLVAHKLVDVSDHIFVLHHAKVTEPQTR